MQSTSTTVTVQEMFQNTILKHFSQLLNLTSAVLRHQEASVFIQASKFHQHSTNNFHGNLGTA